MQTKNILIICLTVTGLIFGLFWVTAPALMKDKVIGLATFASAERKCFNYYKHKNDYFKDPDSAYIESSRILTKEANLSELGKYGSLFLKNDEYISVVEINVYSKNSMGGYGKDKIYCPLTKSLYTENDEDNYWVEQTIWETNLRKQIRCREEESPSEYCLSPLEY